MDEILEVNHVTIRGISHHDASAILRNTPTHVHLALGRTKESESFLKRRSAAARASRDFNLNTERAPSPSSEQYSSNASLNKQSPSPLAVNEDQSQRDSPVPQVVTQEHDETPQQTVVSLLKASSQAQAGITVNSNHAHSADNRRINFVLKEAHLFACFIHLFLTLIFKSWNGMLVIEHG